MKSIISKKLLFKTTTISIIAINVLSYGGAYILTHHRNSSSFSLGLTRPKNKRSPNNINLKYTTETIAINQTEWLYIWSIKAASSESLGTVILFHGKGSSKSSLLASAKEFHLLNYDTLLVDFCGYGNSSGNKTTIGVKEAEDVAFVFNYILQSNSLI